MVRIAKAVAAKKRRNKIRKRAKGFWGDRKGHIGLSKTAAMKADAYNYIHRKQLKRNMRKIWSIRLNIAARSFGLPYNRLIHGLTLAGVILNRKMLSEMAIVDSRAFEQVVNIAKSKLGDIDFKK
ncbi:MAG: 50S ribosomal protein L20 [Chlamydiia bacterium]|nr:50S ribosomal protein L20 [Chlamydiia bacterium]